MCVSLWTGVAHGAAPTDPLLDAVERQLELDRHARLLARQQAADSRLAPFSTDGCSGGLSLGWERVGGWLAPFRQLHGARPPWEPCCIAHDRHYHAAAPPEASAEASFAARRAADLELRACVLATGAARAPALSALWGVSEARVATLYTAIADAMYRAVRVGGAPCTPLPWRWGYGWPACD